MKYIKKFEAFDVLTTDTPDVKMAKQKMETITKQLAEYKTKKPLIDAVYTKTKDPSLIESELTKILGSTDVQNGPDRNPFLVDYTYLAKLKRDMDKMREDNVNDKVKLDDFQVELRLTTDPNTKQILSTKIAEITKRMLDKVTNINKTQNDFNIKDKEHKDKMLKIESDMKEYITKISNVNQKYKKYRFFLLIYTLK